MGAEEEGKKRRVPANVQNLCNDGMNVCGRFTSLSGIFVLGCYLIALLSPTWSVVESTKMKDGLENVTKTQYGLNFYCVTTAVSVFDGEFPTCFEYEDILTVRTMDENGTMGWNNQTGCARFPVACDIKHVVLGSLGVSCLFLIFGCVFSEKVPFNGAMQMCAAIGGIVGMAAWVHFQSSLEEMVDSAPTPGVGLGILVGGWVVAILGAISAMIDTMKIPKDQRPSLFNDGINLSGRIGSFATVFTWMLFLLAVLTPNWSTTSDLGQAGNLCNPLLNETAPCTNNKATFGLGELCVETKVPLYGNVKETVCLLYTDSANVIGLNNTQTGYERFADFDLQIRSEATLYCGIIAVATAIFADIFSEKLLPSAILMLLSTLAGMAAMVAWLLFEKDIDKGTSSAVTTDTGLYLVIGGWIIALIGHIFYCVDWRRQGRNTGGGGDEEEPARRKTMDSKDVKEVESAT
eukprot:m.151760 g.151760  ORF g.151760 m.151760 type:complete len:463 (-) comp30778_c0_seq2:2-1390(-)